MNVPIHPKVEVSRNAHFFAFKIWTKLVKQNLGCSNYNLSLYPYTGTSAVIKTLCEVGNSKSVKNVPIHLSLR